MIGEVFRSVVTGGGINPEEYLKEQVESVKQLTEYLETIKEFKNKYTNALIIVDMQNDFVENKKAKDIVPKVKEMLEYARNNRWAIVHVKREYSTDGYYEKVRKDQAKNDFKGFAGKGTSGAKIIPELEPKDSENGCIEIVRIKPTFSSFDGTHLGPILNFLQNRPQDIKIHIAGTNLANCVYNTVFGAIKDYPEVVLIKDAVSGELIKNPDSGELETQEEYLNRFNGFITSLRAVGVGIEEVNNIIHPRGEAGRGGPKELFPQHG